MKKWKITMRKAHCKKMHYAWINTKVNYVSTFKVPDYEK